MKLKLRVDIFDKGVAIQVLEMDERFRTISKSSKRKEYYSSFNKTIVSGAYPNVSEMQSILYLHGYMVDKDSCIISTHFHSNERRDQWLAEIRASLAEWSEKWKGFNKGKKDKTEEGIWEF